jgi:hypothetical protein
LDIFSKYSTAAKNFPGAFLCCRAGRTAPSAKSGTSKHSTWQVTGVMGYSLNGIWARNLRMERRKSHTLHFSIMDVSGSLKPSSGYPRPLLPGAILPKGDNVR